MNSSTYKLRHPLLCFTANLLPYGRFNRDNLFNPTSSPALPQSKSIVGTHPLLLAHSVNKLNDKKSRKVKYKKIDENKQRNDTNDKTTRV